MAYLHKEYQEINGQTVKFAISFNKDRTNWATSQPKKIGYQVTATPVKITKYDNGIVMEESGAFTGFNDCLLEVDRQSSKRLQSAIAQLAVNMDQYKQWFTDRANN